MFMTINSPNCKLPAYPGQPQMCFFAVFVFMCMCVRVLRKYQQHHCHIVTSSYHRTVILLLFFSPLQYNNIIHDTKYHHTGDGSQPQTDAFSPLEGNIMQLWHLV